jgi:hypothetical protein
MSSSFAGFEYCGEDNVITGDDAEPGDGLTKNRLAGARQLYTGSEEASMYQRRAEEAGSVPRAEIPSNG